MIKENFTFLSSDGRTSIHAVKWLPDTKEYHAVLQITHGMQEYIERYCEFAEFLTDRGFLVVGHDHLGHGESISSPAEYGFFCETAPSDKLIQDMHTLRCMIQGENPDIPYFMFGHSMGSYMLRKYITKFNQNLSGVMIAGTGSMPDAVMKLGMMLCKILAGIKGWHHKSAWIRKLSFLGAYKEFDVTGQNLKNNWLTKDLEIARRYYQDPKCRFDFTVNGYYGLMEAVYYDNQSDNISRIPKNLPLFLVSGAKDPVGDMGVGVKKAYDQYKAAGISDITWKLYENDRHELLNEVDRQDVFQEIYTWMSVRISK